MIINVNELPINNYRNIYTTSIWIVLGYCIKWLSYDHLNIQKYNSNESF